MSNKVPYKTIEITDPATFFSKSHNPITNKWRWWLHLPEPVADLFVNGDYEELKESGSDAK